MFGATAFDRASRDPNRDFRRRMSHQRCSGSDSPFRLDAVPFDVIAQVGVRKADVLADLRATQLAPSPEFLYLSLGYPKSFSCPAPTVEPLGRWAATAPARYI
jgi:hypothetical protein